MWNCVSSLLFEALDVYILWKRVANMANRSPSIAIYIWYRNSLEFFVQYLDGYCSNWNGKTNEISTIPECKSCFRSARLSVLLLFHTWARITLCGSRLNVRCRFSAISRVEESKNWQNLTENVATKQIRILSAILKCYRNELWENYRKLAQEAREWQQYFAAQSQFARSQGNYISIMGWGSLPSPSPPAPDLIRNFKELFFEFDMEKKKCAELIMMAKVM